VYRSSAGDAGRQRTQHAVFDVAVLTVQLNAGLALPRRFEPFPRQAEMMLC
jgi:hypothetical protein